MSEHADGLKRRIGGLAVAVLRFVRGLPGDVATDSVIRQVARSAASVSANYRAACCGRSRQEFIARLGVAVEEADETTHWLWMAAQLSLGNSHELARLTQEAREVQAILSASLSTARRNHQRAQSARRQKPTTR